MSQLACPKCAHPMDPWQSRGLALDHCFKCKGLWFDEGELRQHLANSHIRLSEGDFKMKGETRFPCPRCSGVRLGQVRVSSVTLDVCPRCRGIFLDLGEVHELIGAIARREYAADPAAARFDNLALGLYIGAGLSASPKT
jgi:Zn-finger nucleic acid-binding protein